jgi:prepilin-type N-terminal cleavage/methylation domain-containing protein
MSARKTQGGRAAVVAAGFTLVEILCVVVILGIASAIIIPQIGSRDDLTASSATRVIMADLIYAQNRAIATQKWHYVQFDGQQYLIYDQAPPASPNAALAIDNPVSLDKYVQVFSNPSSAFAKVKLDSWDFGGPSVLMFDELGSPFA